MKKILNVILNLIKNNKIITIVILAFIILIGIIYFQKQKIDKLNNKYQKEIKLKNALLDSVQYYQNKENEWVAERLTIQETVKNLEKMTTQLTTSQKELLNRVKEVEKSNSIITAALIETNIKIDELKPNVTVNDSSVIFSDSTKNLEYEIEIEHVKPINFAIKPTLNFNKFNMPNKQFIEFHWKDDKKNGYPVSFSVTNSNEFFKTTNINSYAIPELNKNDINPNNWHKFGNWVIKNGKIITYIGVGGLVGGGTVWLLTK